MQRFQIAPVPGDFNGVPDSPFHAGGGGVKALCHGGVEDLGNSVDDFHVFYSDHNGLPQVLVAFDVGRDADLMDHSGDHIFQRCRIILGLWGRLCKEAVHTVNNGIRRTGLREEVACAQAFRIGQHLVPAEGGGNDNLWREAVLCSERLQQADAVQPREGHIHEQQVRV